MASVVEPYPGTRCQVRYYCTINASLRDKSQTMLLLLLGRMDSPEYRIEHSTGLPTTALYELNKRPSICIINCHPANPIITPKPSPNQVSKGKISQIHGSQGMRHSSLESSRGHQARDGISLRGATGQPGRECCNLQLSEGGKERLFSVKT